MPKLHLPETFTNFVTYQDAIDGRLVSKTKEVKSPVQPIQVPYSGPLSESFAVERDEKGMVKDPKFLRLNPGETKEFTEKEAAFLLKRYPFIESAEDIAAVGTPAAPAIEVEISDLGAREEVPSNFMQLKKYVQSRGVSVEKTDKKDDLLRKLAELK